MVEMLPSYYKKLTIPSEKLAYTQGNENGHSR